MDHLNELDLEVECFLDASELIAQAERKPATAVIVDLRYSLSDPLSAVQRLAEASSDKRPRLVAISDKPYEFDRNRAINLGVDAYFIQPVKREDFLHQLESLLHDFRKGSIGEFGEHFRFQVNRPFAMAATPRV